MTEEEQKLHDLLLQKFPPFIGVDWALGDNDSSVIWDGTTLTINGKIK